MFANRESYLSVFEEVLRDEANTTEELSAYLTEQIAVLEASIKALSEDNFWDLFPKILGIDAKLVLSMELINFGDFSDEEIIRLTESDYQTYFKEFCGYKISQKPKHSLIFNVT